MSIETRKFGLTQTFLIGLLALLPLAVTIAVVIWIAGFLAKFVGPGSFVGKQLVTLGLSFVNSSVLAYFAGALVVVGGIFLLGLLLQLGLQAPLRKLIHGLLRRIPMVGSIYDLAERFLNLLDKKGDPKLKGMTPVWCHFGGEGGTAVLALLPSPEPVDLGGQRYLGVLVPTAPVPVGGGLLFVPEAWVKPAPFGVEGLTSVYVSMGVTVPAVLAKSGARKGGDSPGQTGA